MKTLIEVENKTQLEELLQYLYAQGYSWEVGSHHTFDPLEYEIDFIVLYDHHSYLKWLTKDEYDMVDENNIKVIHFTEYMLENKGNMEKEVGKKYDGEKTRYDLVPASALEEMAKVMTFGATKYGPNNWQHIENLDERYFSAAMRHLWAVKRGEKIDPESGLHHYAHAACCVFFMLDNAINEYDKK